MASRALAAARPPDPPGYIGALRQESIRKQRRPDTPAEAARAPRRSHPVAELWWATTTAASHFAAPRGLIFGRTKGRGVSLARQLSVCLLRARYSWSFEEISIALGINSASAIHAFRHRWGTAEHALVFEAYQLGRNP